MRCDHCGTESSKGSFFCGGCGQPIGFKPSVIVAEEESGGLPEVPPPMPSAERDEVVLPGRKALCSLCMGAYLETELAVVDGSRYCVDCNPLTATKISAPDRGDAQSYGSDIPASRTFNPVVTETPTGSRGLLIFAGVLVALAGIFAVVALPGSDRIDKLAGGVSVRDDGFTLAQRYEPGTCLQYGMKISGTVQMDAEQGRLLGDVLAGDMEMDFGGTIRIDVLSVDTDGNARVSLAMSHFEMAVTGLMTQNGQQVPLDRTNPVGSLGETSVLLTLDPFGKPVGEVEVLKDGLGGMMDLKQVLGSGVEDAPRGELHVGDTWSSTAVVPMQGGSGMNLKAEYEVAGFKCYEGRECIVILVEGEMNDGAGGSFMMPGMSMNASVDMKGVVLIDAEKGHLVKSAMDLDISMEAGTSEGSMSMEMKLQADVDLR